jgi:DNA-binding MarR family transcriptional regulator
MTDLYDMPGHLVRRLQQIAVAAFHAEVDRLDLGLDLTPVQFAALSTLRDRPGIDQATLAGLIAYDRTTIGGVLDRLVQKGLIERRQSRTDRRARTLEISDNGRQTLKLLEPAVLAAQRSMLAGLDPGEVKEFMRLLRKATDGANALSRAPLRLPGDKPA